MRQAGRLGPASAESVPFNPLLCVCLSSFKRQMKSEWRAASRGGPIKACLRQLSALLTQRRARKQVELDDG